jgi:3-hydroxyacyl-CoA dehydrogenase/enoyl-CoA hydratase/3-hydroxybutyryl-CoA epimerase
LPKLKQWTLEIDVERIAWLTIDTPGSAVNMLGRSAIEELERIVAYCEDRAASGEIVGVVLLSGKSSGFIAGADISEFDAMSNPAVLPEALKRTHAVFQRIEDMKVPIVAGIHGFCLGGGLELALACHFRIAVNTDRTRIGFPEIKLGIFPGFGGTGRSIRQAGPVDAMQIMLTGRYLRAGAARRMGLVDKLVRHQDQLRWEARKAVLRKRTSRPAGWRKRLLGKDLLRGWIVSRMRREAARKARPEHYPAPGALIDLFEKHGNHPKAMSAAEIEAFVPLMATGTAANLRRVFFLSEGLKKQGQKASARPGFRRVHVVGAGVMGGDIAAWCAMRGMAVTLQDLDMERIQPALDRAKKLFSRRLKSTLAVKAAEARLCPDVEGKGVARADVIIEAVVEKLEIKHKVFADLEARAKPNAILATNTSSIELERIAEGMKTSGRLIGLHFFNPVSQLPLVEVVRSKLNDEHIIRLGCSFVSAIGKSPVVVRSAPGFLVNRVLMPYMIGAVERVEQGERKEVIDAAAVAFGMPMGPIELMDTVGLDIAKSVAEELGHDLAHDSRFAGLVAAGKLGRKSGEGYYRWREGKALKGELPEQFEAAELGRELIKPLVDECEKCVAEGIVASADLADIGVIFGTGFAPFLGGPLKARADGRA